MFLKLMFEACGRKYGVERAIAGTMGQTKDGRRSLSSGEVPKLGDGVRLVPSSQLDRARDSGRFCEFTITSDRYAY